ncbi:MAG: DUF4349 domain-containing protein [Roseburia sp.]
MKKRKVWAAGAVFLLAMMTGCGSNKSDLSWNENTDTNFSDYGIYSDYSYSGEAADYEYAEDYESGAVAESGNQAEQVEESAEATGRKLIRTVDLEVETEEFESVLSQVEQKVSALGGYVEDSSLYQGSMYSRYSSRTADYTIRIPQDRLDEFIQIVEEGTNVTYKQNSVQDITLSYVDLKSHKEALEAEQTRLLELLDMAEDMSDVLAIEDELTNVRYQIESMESQLRTYDNQVDYATVNLYISEVERLTELPDESAWSRITTGFSNSLYSIGTGAKELGIWILIKLPYLLLWGIVILIVVLVIRKIRKKRRLKKQERTSGKTGNASPQAAPAMQNDPNVKQ